MYIYNGLKINDAIIIGGVRYPLNWWDQQTDADLLALGVSKVADPVYPNPKLYTWTENPDGTLTITARTQGEIDATYAANQANNIAQLWQAAHDYEYSFINGSAVGLVTLGILQRLPKCIAVSQWINSIWALYYTRKATVTDVLDSALLDFSSIGPMPYTIPELMAEVGY